MSPLVELGAGFRPRLEPEVVLPPPPDPAVDRLDAVLYALAELRDVLATMPAPVVRVEPTDLTDIVTAVQSLKGPATADEIARAVRDALVPPVPAEDTATNRVLERLLEALEKLDFRMKGIGTQAYGGGAVKLEPGQVVTAVGGASEETLLDIKRHINDYETRFDYGTRTDSNPVRVGTAFSGTATTATGWTIQNFTYDASSRPTRISVTQGVWE